MGYGRGVRVSPRAADNSPGGQADPESSNVFSAERGKPVSLPLGKRAARQADGGAGRGCRKKRTPPCNEADRGSESAPARKGADFRLVLNHEKGLGRLNRKGTDRQWLYNIDGLLSSACSWNTINWQTAVGIVKRLQAHIVKAASTAGCFTASYQGLSRVR